MTSTGTAVVFAAKDVSQKVLDAMLGFAVTMLLEVALG